MTSRILGSKIKFDKPGVDEKSGLYAAKPYRPAAKTYKPKPYTTKPTNYKHKDYKPKSLGYGGSTKPYKAHVYDHIYEYNPDYNPDAPKKKRIPRPSVPKVVVTPSPAAEDRPKTRPPTAESIQMWPARFNPVASVKRQINMTFKSRVDPMVEPMPIYEKNTGEFT